MCFFSLLFGYNHKSCLIIFNSFSFSIRHFLSSLKHSQRRRCGFKCLKIWFNGLSIALQPNNTGLARQQACSAFSGVKQWKKSNKKNVPINGCCACH
jgi:hypothetical protein